MLCFCSPQSKALLLIPFCFIIGVFKSNHLCRRFLQGQLAVSWIRGFDCSELPALQSATHLQQLCQQALEPRCLSAKCQNLSHIVLNVCFEDHQLSAPRRAWPMAPELSITQTAHWVLREWEIYFNVSLKFPVCVLRERYAQIHSVCVVEWARVLVLWLKWLNSRVLGSKTLSRHRNWIHFSGCSDSPNVYFYGSTT